MPDSIHQFRKRPYKSVFFDFDGVLVESAAIKAAAFQSLYGEYGAKVVARVAAHHKANEGISRLIKIRQCHREFLGLDLSEDALATLGATYSTTVEDEVAASDGVTGARVFLERYHQTLSLFVISGTPQDELRRIAGRRGIAEFFVEVRGSPPGKYAILRDLLDRHDLAPEEALFVGDAMADWHAAAACGVDFLGRVRAGHRDQFPSGTRTTPDLRELGNLVTGGGE